MLGESGAGEAFSGLAEILRALVGFPTTKGFPFPQRSGVMLFAGSSFLSCLPLPAPFPSQCLPLPRAAPSQRPCPDGFFSPIQELKQPWMKLRRLAVKCHGKILLHLGFSPFRALPRRAGTPFPRWELEFQPIAGCAKDPRGAFPRLPGCCSCRASQGSCAGPGDKGRAAAGRAPRADSKGCFAARSPAGSRGREGREGSP